MHKADDAQHVARKQALAVDEQLDEQGPSAGPVHQQSWDSARVQLRCSLALLPMVCRMCILERLARSFGGHGGAGKSKLSCYSSLHAYNCNRHGYCM